MNNQKLTFYLDQAIDWITLGVVALTPLLFVPVLTDWFDFPKQAFLLFGSVLVVALMLIRSVILGKLPFNRSAFMLPALVLVTATFISAFISPNRYIALASDPVGYTGIFLLFVVLTQLTTTEKFKTRLLLALFGSGAILSLLALAQVAMFFSKFTYQFVGPFFSPAGSPMSQALFLAILLPFCLGIYAHKRTVVNTIFAAVLSIGLVASIFVTVKNQPVLLPPTTGWKIATNTIGVSLQSAFLGAGPSNFIDTFTINKGLDLNATPFWNLRFSTSSNLYFYLLTTVGIAGLAGFIWLVARIVILARKRLETGVAQPMEKGFFASLIAAIVLFALFPTPIVALLAFFVLLAIPVTEVSVQTLPDVSAQNTWVRPVGAVATVVAFAFLVWQLGGSFLQADYYFARSLDALAANRGTDAYNLQIAATTANPWNDSYRVAYSQTNLALANALAGQPNLTDEQKQTVVALVQQAIREARLAASLAPNRAGNYENLSLIYRGLINFAQGADQWAVASQNQAVNLDPANPRLRLDLGGIYFSQKDYQTAGQIFANAVALKADFANSHYNLAQAMKLLGLKDQAIQQLQATASLVCSPIKTPDCDRVNAEITELGAPAPASPSAVVPQQVATSAAQPTNLPKTQPKPPVKVASPSGELAQ